MAIGLYSDSDWAGSLESRTSTDCHVAIVCGAVVARTTPHATRTASYQQPRCGTETFFSAAREAIYLRDLIALDFGQLCGKRADSSLVQASKCIGPGAKLRHLEVCEFYVQGALQSKQIKVKGTFNCANFLTKHPKSGTKVKQALDRKCMKLATEKTCYHRLNASPSRSPL